MHASDVRHGIHLPPRHPNTSNTHRHTTPPHLPVGAAESGACEHIDFDMLAEVAVLVVPFLIVCASTHRHRCRRCTDGGGGSGGGGMSVRRN